MAEYGKQNDYDDINQWHHSENNHKPQDVLSPGYLR